MNEIVIPLPSCKFPELDDVTNLLADIHLNLSKHGKHRMLELTFLALAPPFLRTCGLTPSDKLDLRRFPVLPYLLFLDLSRFMSGLWNQQLQESGFQITAL